MSTGEKPLTKNLKADLASHLINLEDVDVEEIEEVEISTPEKLYTSDIQDEAKMKLYRNAEFKKFLQGFLEKKHNIKKEKIKNRYSEKVYRSMYTKNVLPNKK